MSGWVAGAVVGSTVIGGVMGNKAAGTQADAANRAADIQGQSAAEATALQREMWQQQVTAQKPWQEAGVNALTQLTQGTAPGGTMVRPFAQSDYQADPGYAFRLKEGMKALESTAAARGGLLSGNAMRGAVGYGQEMGSQEYQNAYNRYQTNQGNQYNRLASMAGLGQTANTALGQAGQQYANQAGGNIMSTGVNAGNAALAAGNANASSYQGWGNAIGTGINQLARINWNPQSSSVQMSGGGTFDAFGNT
ncbi:MAG: hypothetical protein WAV93_11540 [Bacteroidales bacterium]